MLNENSLLQKLAVSKKIMDIHNGTPRNQLQGNLPTTPELQEFSTSEGKYNIPQELMIESQPKIKTNNEVPTKDRILQSKLPDEIKRLMIEHPIHQPNSPTTTGSVLSDELVEKAARLMNNNVANNVSHFQQKPKQETSKLQTENSNIDKNMLKSLIRETIEEVLGENGLLVESTSKSNDVFQFRVGSHIFEGKVTKIKKIK